MEHRPSWSEASAETFPSRVYAWLIRRWYPIRVDPALVRAEIDRWWVE